MLPKKQTLFKHITSLLIQVKCNNSRDHIHLRLTKTNLHADEFSLGEGEGMRKRTDMFNFSEF